MSPLRPARATLTLAALLLATALPALALAAAPAARPVTLVETRPVESTLGNAALPEAHTVWLDLIAGARRRLDIEQFYLSDWPGERTGPVLDAIGAAAKRGVKVRLLLDGRMSTTYPMPGDSLAKVPGIEVRRIDFRKLGGGVQHAKFFLVDGERTFLGSQNLDWRALKHIHELGVRLDDARVTGVFQQVFEMDWAACDTTAAGRDTLAALRAWFDRASLPTLPIVIVQSPGDTVRVWPSYSPKGFLPEPALWDLDALVKLVDGAHAEVVGQALSYGIGGRGQRDSTLDEALRRAAARGVKVRLVISDWETGGIADLQRLAALPNVSIKLSTVPEWSGGYIPYARVEHCKYLVVDGARVWVGTSNWEPDYFFASRNLAVILADPRLAGQAHQVFETSWAAPGARPVTPDGSYPRKAHAEQSPDGRPVYGR
jgi:phosphatidylserine/phosphatidylglycerophosphate/cardiolipin synthase-like enzyme